MTVDADGRGEPLPGEIVPLQDEEESVYCALVQGTRDYVDKHRFPGVVLGLSGGVDSALTLCIAVDALGAERVHPVSMPSRYTSQMSKEDAAQQAAWLDVKHSEISIEGMFEATLTALKDEFAGRAPGTAEENIQSRCRGVLLMAISNKTGRMLLTTGNKSEMAVGYATLYGDMAGGFAPIKDCSKILVYRLAAWRNARSRVIPARVIDGRRQPSCGPIRRTPTACRPTRCRSHSRGLHRRGSIGRPNRGPRIRPEDRRPDTRSGQAQRIQTPSGPAGGTGERPRFRTRLALSHHQRISNVTLIRVPQLRFIGAAGATDSRGGGNRGGGSAAGSAGPRSNYFGATDLVPLVLRSGRPGWCGISENHQLSR